ncbi:acyltransferase family protein [Nocardioides sp. LS1]|uniref:acyltransferase family protein n=1 Tax=Nocardioides sp. LS1 TaxID=1027620 RepID=UPI000F6245B9|nr:acyltransferase family protein [Nocardioides sp. LS1]GCD90687.1 acyltransferase [Nocardioides sp. LS1]
MPTEHPSIARRAALRRDLQGVRGLGIIFVVVGHLWRWPPGVFAMLDMFFVLSGFLITGILIESFTRYGPRFFVVFYLSRFRRLMPAAVTVIVVTVGLWYLLINSAGGDLVLHDGIWALLLAVNWHFAAMGTDYFASQHDSPLLHYWSLSVEEQFYAVWPLLVFVAVVVATRRARSAQRTLLALLVVVTGGAFAYSLWHSVADPTTAYFSTFDRTWEFGIGGLIAVLSPRLAKLPTWAGALLGWGGTVGLVITLFLLPYGVPFPAPYGLFPALLTAAIMAGGIDRDTRYIPVLDNRVMVYLGDTSYSIYLWHLPVNLLLLPYFASQGTGYYLTAIALTIASALACYYLIEKPLRYNRWLMTPPERIRQLQRNRPSYDVRRLQLGWAAVVVVVAGAFTAAALTATPSASSGGQVTPRPTATPHLKSTLLERHQDRLITALDRGTFPDFDPPLSHLGLEQWGADEAAFGCTTVTADQVDDCRFGDVGARHSAVVIGDSYAIAWMPGIRAALEPRGWSIQQLTAAACPSWRLPSYVTPDGKAFPECATHHELVRTFLQEHVPDLVIVASGAEEVRNSQRQGFTADPALLAYQGLRATLAQLPPAARVVVLAPPPEHADLVDCVTRVAGPERCVSQPGPDWYDHVAGETRAADAAGARYVQTRDWFCVQDDCPAFVGNTPVTADGSHLTLQYARSLSPLLARALTVR